MGYKSRSNWRVNISFCPYCHMRQQYCTCPEITINCLCGNVIRVKSPASVTVVCAKCRRRWVRWYNDKIKSYEIYLEEDK